MSDNGPLVKTIDVKDAQGRVIGTKDVVAYAGLLNRGHEEGLKRLFTQVIQLPTETNRMTAVFLATVETEKGTFTGHGDANPENVDKPIAAHIIRMAETRAKARALRDAVNIGVVAIEELAFNGNGELGTTTVPPAKNGASPASKPATASTNASATSPAKSLGNGGQEKRGNGDSQPQNSSTQVNGRQSQHRNGKGNNGKNGNVPMSDAQRKYIYRLLAEAGIEGEDAHEKVRERCQVQSSKDVTKAQAHKLIEQLLEEAKTREKAEAEAPY